MRILDLLTSILAGSLLSGSTLQRFGHASELAFLPQGVLNMQQDLCTSPLVIWHGLGDSYNSEAMQRVFSLIRAEKPDLYIYLVYLDEDNDKDQQKSILANMNEEIDKVCRRILEDKTLAEYMRSGGSVNAIGFSQGGLFLRGLVQKCPGFHVNNLITFGLPHNGIQDLPQCGTRDWLCKQRNRIVKSRIWDSNIQHSIVFAQYYRNVLEYQQYREHSLFLADLNNEAPTGPNTTYLNRLAALTGKFVMVRFQNDSVVVPRDTAWFADTDPETGMQIDYRNTMQYKQNLVGLRTLGETGRLVFETEPAEHMRISEDTLSRIAKQYL